KRALETVCNLPIPMQKLIDILSTRYHPETKISEDGNWKFLLLRPIHIWLIAPSTPQSEQERIAKEQAIFPIVLCLGNFTPENADLFDKTVMRDAEKGQYYLRQNTQANNLLTLVTISDGYGKVNKSRIQFFFNVSGNTVTFVDIE